MTKLLTALCLLLAITVRVNAQAPPVAPPSFEVGSLRLGQPGTEKSGSWSPPNVGLFNATSVTFERLLILAYGIESNQIVNAPPWSDTELYNVTAKPEAGIKLSREELQPRLQALLQEHLHLVAHREIRQMPGFALVAAKGGPKLVPTAGKTTPDFRVNVSGGTMKGLNWSMAFLALQLQRPAGLPVVDQTGIAGRYDLDLSFAPENGMEADSSLPSLFTALRNTLGLELKKQTVPVEVVVIDRVDRVPTAN